MAGRLIGNGSANSSTLASPSANRRTIDRRVGSDKAAKTTSNRSGAITVIGTVASADTSQISYLTDQLHIVKTRGVSTRHIDTPADRAMREQSAHPRRTLITHSPVG